MKRSSRLTAVGAMLAAAAFAGSWSGTLTDVKCSKNKDIANHARQCAIGCAKSGYGLITEDGKFVKFDQKGNDLALEALKTSSKDKDLKAKVSGDLHGDMIHVSSVELE